MGGGVDGAIIGRNRWWETMFESNSILASFFRNFIDFTYNFLTVARVFLFFKFKIQLFSRCILRMYLWRNAIGIFFFFSKGMKICKWIFWNWRLRRKDDFKHFSSRRILKESICKLGQLILNLKFRLFFLIGYLLVARIV